MKDAKGHGSDSRGGGSSFTVEQARAALRRPPDIPYPTTARSNMLDSNGNSIAPSGPFREGTAHQVSLAEDHGIQTSHLVSAASAYTAQHGFLRMRSGHVVDDSSASNNLDKYPAGKHPVETYRRNPL
jgi:hypothetical protein